MTKLSFKEFELQGWESVAGAYHERFGKFTSQIASALIDKAILQPKDKVLDVACGPGYTAAFALEKGADVIGIDFASAMIEEAQATYPEINFQVMDAEELQFDDQSFDSVFMNFGILHFANPEHVIQEAFRVLKPNGKFFFTVWDKETPFDMVLEAVKEKGELSVALPEGPDFFQFTDPEASKKLLSEIGFDSIAIQQMDFVWQLDNAKEFFRAFYESGVRIGGILRAQKPNNIEKIIQNLELRAKVFEKKKRLEIPIPVLMFQAIKN